MPRPPRALIEKSGSENNFLFPSLYLVLHALDFGKTILLRQGIEELC